MGLHDLRRTYRSALADLGVREEIAEAMIAHRRSGLVARYNRAELWDQRREVAEKFDAWLSISSPARWPRGRQCRAARRGEAGDRQMSDREEAHRLLERVHINNEAGEDSDVKRNAQQKAALFWSSTISSTAPVGATCCSAGW